MAYTANLCTKILDFRGFDSGRILILRGWNSHVHRESPRNFESRNLSRDNLNWETGRGIGRRGSRRAGARRRAGVSLNIRDGSTEGFAVSAPCGGEV